MFIGSLFFIQISELKQAGKYNIKSDADFFFIFFFFLQFSEWANWELVWLDHSSRNWPRQIGNETWQHLSETGQK